MNVFSLNAFYLGAMLFLCIGLTNILYSLLCFAWQIKIVEFVIFSNPWFSFYSENLIGTKFILGWLPLSCHIKPLGMLKSDIDEGKICLEDLPFTFQNKSKFQQKIFHLTPWIVWSLILIISLYSLDNTHNIIKNIQEVGNYALYSFQTMFSDQTKKAEFISITKNILMGKAVVPFSIILLVGFILLFSPLGKIIGWFSDDEKKKTKVKKFIGFLMTIAVLYLCLWKIPSFVFSFFSFAQIIKYLLSFSIGLFVIGTTVFFTVIFLAKNYVLKIKSL